MAEARPLDTGIEIRGLYKIFGPSPRAMTEHVRAGMTKAELMARHGHVLGLRDINLTMAAGSIQVIMGLSGSGKSTLIRHINRLVEPTAGQVLVGGIDVIAMSKPELRAFRRHQTAMVFQRFGLLPHRTVLDNAVYGLAIRGLPRAKQVEAARYWIGRVGLDGFENHFPNQLSGGMQQRVGLARALANDAPILLMDEAFSALDPLIRMDMQSVLLDLQKEIRKTIVFITHDLDEALRLGDRIAILRDGEVIQQGTSQDIVLRPADDYIERFVREVNRGRVVRVETVMAPVGELVAEVEGPGDNGASVPVGTTLDDAIRRLLASGAPTLGVTDADGALVGRLDLARLAGALVADRPQVAATALPLVSPPCGSAPTSSAPIV